MHTLSPNIYRTWDESLEAFEMFSEVTSLTVKTSLSVSSHTYSLLAIFPERRLGAHFLHLGTTTSHLRRRRRHVHDWQAIKEAP